MFAYNSDHPVNHAAIKTREEGAAIGNEDIINTHTGICPLAFKHKRTAIMIRI
jgi:hypothetical protein